MSKHLNILRLICINRYYPLKLGICLHSHMCPSSLNSKTRCHKSRFKFCELFNVGALQQIQHGHKISATDQLKHMLIECWTQLILNTLPPSINQLPKRIDDSYECKSWASPYVEFHLNSTHVLMIVDISLYAE